MTLAQDVVTKLFVEAAVKYKNLKKKIKNIMSEVNKNKKYTIVEKSNIVKKVSNETDKTTLLAKVVSIISAIKVKHLS